MANQFFTVDQEESIGAFLLRVARYPQFKIPVLLECGAVIVRRDNQNVELKQKHELVKPPEIVLIQESKCADKLNSFPSEKYRDYAFVPQPEKGDEYLPGMRETLKLRPQTVVLDNRQNLQSFLDLRRSDIVHPVRDLLIVSHGNAQGLLELPLDVNATQIVQYEDLQKLANGGSLRIDPRFVQPRPKDPSGKELPFTLRIHGCQIGAIPRYLQGKPGAVPPLLALLKKATGVRITAPKYFHGVGANPRQRGWFEYLTYDFTLYTKEPLANLAAVAEAFRAKGGYTFFDGSPVPPDQWAKWLKARVEKEQQRRLPEPQKADRSLPLRSVPTVSPVDGKDLPVSADLWLFKEEPFHNVQTIKLPAEPVTDQDKRQEVMKALRQRDEFKESHPYPWWGRLGYRTLEDFVADLQIFWEADEDTPEPQDGTLAYFLERNQYILRIPITCARNAKGPTDASGRVLLANFYPPSPADPVILLEEEDERFFTTV